MNGAFYIGAVGLEAQQRALEVVADNIANINTVGFKRTTVRFSELVAATRDAADLPVATSDKADQMAGVTVDATPRVWSDGELKPTGNPLDLAIKGPGFLELLGPSGHSLLWRGGTLKVNADGFLAAADGTPLRAMISVPRDASALSIAADGKISAIVGGKTDAEELGQLDLVMVHSPDKLTDAGSGYYEATDPADVFALEPGNETSSTFVQGVQEASNVELTEEMTSLLVLQRAFAANAQVVQAGDQLMSIVNGLRR